MQTIEIFDNLDGNDSGRFKASEDLPIQTSMGTESVQYRTTAPAASTLFGCLNEILEEIVIPQCETKRRVDIASGKPKPFLCGK